MKSLRTMLFALLPGAVLGAASLLTPAAFAAAPAAPAPQYVPPTVAVTNPLADVKYNAKWEIYGGMAYSHFDAGPQLIQGASLGGVDAQVARFFTKRWAAVGNYRGYFGTSGVQPNVYNIRGPFVAEHMFVFGPEYRAIYNKHLSLNFHAYAGGAYGDFQRATAPLTNREVQSQLGLYTNQFTIASVIGGSLDLNRSARWAFRIEPDATLTRFNNPGGPTGIQQQFALSVGVVYRFVPHPKGYKKPVRPHHHRRFGVF
uniref:Outer membrane protein beta-barrel domain-containing protein n=1 Tax=Acidobacterium capsulatum TaxID=33075 RepID=A0A7V4XS87_9BACT